MKYKPMLAHAAKDERAILSDSGYLAERKYDGHRGQLCHSPAGGLHLWSRLGNDRMDDVPFLRELMKRHKIGMILDGELWLPGGSSSDVADLSNRDKLVYVVFDILELRGAVHINVPFLERREILNQVVAELDDPRVKLSEVSSDASELLSIVKAEGGEGIMMKKKKDGVYQPGKRSWNWQKIKVRRTMSVIITGADAPPSKWTVTPGNYGTDGVLYPEGKPSSTAEAGYVGLTYGFWMDGQPVKIGKLGVTGPPEEMRLHVGKVAEVEIYGQYKKTKALRHVQFLHFRDDIRLDECVSEQN